MSQTTFKSFSLFAFILFCCPRLLVAGEKKPTELRQSMHQLFSHKAHSKALKGSTFACIECHTFAVKTSGSDPLSQNVSAGHLAISPKVCHECHLGKVEVARVNQCSLCHLHPESLKPESHLLGWRTRHGAFAQMNPTSCNSCHQENQNSCANCHSQKNILKPNVHRPNFRMTHSIEARSNPASCITCHSNLNTCIQCHRGGISR